MLLLSAVSRKEVEKERKSWVLKGESARSLDEEGIDAPALLPLSIDGLRPQLHVCIAVYQRCDHREHQDQNHVPKCQSQQTQAHNAPDLDLTVFTYLRCQIHRGVWTIGLSIHHACWPTNRRLLAPCCGVTLQPCMRSEHEQTLWDEPAGWLLFNKFLLLVGRLMLLRFGTNTTMSALVPATMTCERCSNLLTRPATSKE
ncbi:hypothetical protein BU25DRAFT_109487 [Macroventuria anomochaeta]|uniref:Uncharacterized protein n=1 Tax=Macroventuria anomochaeta TaxID=301207 RepID=A0ACB6RXP8_9PLEO|nr:uncharacterized protein BU25DRAFT_109487 [Macroventuria anomochaeta]KAF2625704.1 hypothetical protein BU25DRAFT_109487 [Macroventuria anomochaeta]